MKKEIAIATKNVVTKLGGPTSALRDRFDATENFAEKQNRANGVKAQVTLANGVLHSVVTDGKTTVEIYDGQIAVKVQESKE